MVTRLDFGKVVDVPFKVQPKSGPLVAYSVSPGLGAGPVQYVFVMCIHQTISEAKTRILRRCRLHELEFSTDMRPSGLVGVDICRTSALYSPALYNSFRVFFF